MKPTQVEIEKPKTWVKYLPQNCKGCFAGCCTLPVDVTAEDLYHMGFLKLIQVADPPTRILAPLKKKGILVSYSKSQNTFRLKQHANHDCIFLDKKRLCKIYDRRPQICRSFPENSRRPGFCPHQKID